MIKNYSIELNGKTIPNILDVVVRTHTPHDDRGIHREATTAVTITITRDASNKAVVDAFALATNQDGKKFIFAKGIIECIGDDKKDSYTFGIKAGYVSHWSLNNPSQPNAPTTETFELRVGWLEYKAGGKGATFLLKDFR